LNAWGSRPNRKIEVTFVRWSKVISWRANGDGVGSAHLVEDCFIRSADDCSYIKGNRRRCVFWKDANAAVFHMSGITTDFPLVIEDCDVIYNRTRGVTGGGVFVQRGQGVLGQRTVDVTVRNFRVTDPRSNMPTFNMFSKDGTNASGSSFKGITFENVTISNKTANGAKEVLQGAADAVWNGGIYFNNVTIAGKCISLSDFSINQYTSNISFSCSNLGVNDLNIDQKKSIQIYPNPTSDKLNIKSAYNDVKSIELIDLSGKVIYTQEGLKENESLDLTKYSPGLYIVKIYNLDDTIYIEKVLKK
jgi:hypothetical protein